MTLVKSLVAACLVLLAMTPALADSHVSLPDNTFMAAQSTDEYLAKDLFIGATVQNDDGKIIGDIEDVILNSSNRVVGVVIGTGGFLGIAEKRIGVTLDALTFTQTDGKTVVTLPGVTKAHLKEVKAFERARPKKSLLERAMEKARELTDKSSETASDAYEATKKNTAPALEKAKEAAGKAYEKAKKAAGEAYEKAKNVAGEAYEKAKDAAKSSTEKAAPEKDSN